MAEEPRPYWHALLHRWFVEYNPLYVLSAALMLRGMTWLSEGLVAEGSEYGALGVAAIAEVYSWALIGGAALLMRWGQRRPATMLALLTALYAGDPTLHTETSAYLGGVGKLAASMWLAGFALKLVALTRALRLRPSPSALGVPILGALGLVVLPHSLPHLDETAGAGLVAGWGFAVASLALWTTRAVASAAPLDEWGRTVLRRSVAGTWAIWTASFAIHAMFWCSEFDLSAIVALPAGVLLLSRFARRELTVWAICGAALLLAARLSPQFTSLVALLAAVTLVVRALRKPGRIEAEVPHDLRSPYRTAADAPCRTERPPIRLDIPNQGERSRLLVGAFLALHLAAWSRGWTGGAWPEHVLAFDLALTAALFAMTWRTRIALAPLAVVALWLRVAVQANVVGAPATTLQWGVLGVSAGFVLLFVGVAVSWRGQRALEPPPPD